MLALLFRCEICALSSVLCECCNTIFEIICVFYVFVINLRRRRRIKKNRNTIKYTSNIKVRWYWIWWYRFTKVVLNQLRQFTLVVRDNRKPCQKCKWAFYSRDKWVRFFRSNQYGQVVVNPERLFGTNDGGSSDLSFSFWFILFVLFHFDPVINLALNLCMISCICSSIASIFDTKQMRKPHKLQHISIIAVQSYDISHRMPRWLRFSDENKKDTNVQANWVWRSSTKKKTRDEISATEGKCATFLLDSLRLQIEN